MDAGLVSIGWNAAEEPADGGPANAQFATIVLGIDSLALL